VGGLAVAVVGGVLAYSVYKSRGLTPLPPSTPTSGGCTTSSQCPSGYICVNGECVQPTGCSSSSQCPPNYVCENGACVPVGQCGTQGAPCSSTSQCCSGYTCLDGVYARVAPLVPVRVQSSGTQCSARVKPLVPAIISPSSTQYTYLLGLADLLFVWGDGGYIEVYRVLPEWLPPVRSLYESHRG